MRNCLPSRTSCVDTDIIAIHGRIERTDLFPHILHQARACIDLCLAKLEIGCHMPFGDDQAMMLGDRITVTDGICELILADDPILTNFTEWTGRIPTVVRFTDNAKIGVVPISLHRITAIAQGLKVAQIVRTTLTTRNDVVDLQGLLLCGNTA